MILNRLKADLKEYRFALAGLLIYYSAARLFFRAFCPMVILTGLPCAGCGLSRAVWFLLTGQLQRSFSMHPLAAFWLLAILYVIIQRYVRGRRMPKYFRSCLLILLAATLLLYCYRMLTLFPDRPPMSYTGRNLMERFIPDYRHRIRTFFRLYR